MIEENKTLDERIDSLSKKLDEMAVVSSPFYAGYSSALSEDEIDLHKLWDIIWQGKWIVVGITIFFTFASVVYAFSLPNMYRSEALLAPVEENSAGGLAGVAGQLGGLASLAGVNLQGGGSDKTTLALKVLKSREFISYFIDKHDLLVPLMAAKGWNRERDELVLDSDIFDSEAGVWLRKASPPLQAQPSMQEAFKEFSSLFDVSQDKQTKFVTISFEFYSPTLSRQWVDWLVNDINLVLKTRDVAEAERSIKYLTEQLEKTSIADMQSIFFDLIEEQTKTVMFAEVREEYVFKTIDRAVVPELKSKPKRALILVLGIILGGILGAFSVFFRYLLKKSEQIK